MVRSLWICSFLSLFLHFPSVQTRKSPSHNNCEQSCTRRLLWTSHEQDWLNTRNRILSWNESFQIATNQTSVQFYKNKVRVDSWDNISLPFPAFLELSNSVKCIWSWLKCHYFTYHRKAWPEMGLNVICYILISSLAMLCTYIVPFASCRCLVSSGILSQIFSLYLLLINSRNINSSHHGESLLNIVLLEGFSLSSYGWCICLIFKET